MSRGFQQRFKEGNSAKQIQLKFHVELWDVK